MNTDKLKEKQNEVTEIISGFNIHFENLDDCYDFENRLHNRIAETYQLGRDETISEIEIALFEIRSGANFCDAETVYEHIQSKLNQLKERK